jgi:hypothetical protein
MTKITHNEKTIVPCINCITYAMCRSQCHNVLGFYKDIIPKCEIIREYLNVTGWSNIGFNFKQSDDIEEKIESVKQVLKIPLIKILPT